ncbi:hypothetical protein [uncultured Halomonas sp.]|uniref:hypothetical protein n=1 Tax=uncultured Halomonas sp. TaxID=173971 RepID=UPI00260F903F|nr:hypothetical protein [uncultured Halomonas sp.]
MFKPPRQGLLQQPGLLGAQMQSAQPTQMNQPIQQQPAPQRQSSGRTALQPPSFSMPNAQRHQVAQQPAPQAPQAPQQQAPQQQAPHQPAPQQQAPMGGQQLPQFNWADLERRFQELSQGGGRLWNSMQKRRAK